MAFIERVELCLGPRQSRADRVKAKLHSFRNLLVTQAAVEKLCCVMEESEVGGLRRFRLGPFDLNDKLSESG
jgi:hypothetical protein